MHLGSTTILGLALIASCALASSALADSIDLSYSHSQASAGIRPAPFDHENVFTQSWDWDLSTSASSGGATSTTETEVTATSIRFSGNWTTAPTPDSFAMSVAYVDFVVDGACDYMLTGGASAENGHGFGQLNYEVYLHDYEANTHSFYNYQLSHGDVSDESFQLGSEDGSAFNSLTGSLTGTLVSGRRYRLLLIGEVYCNSTATPGMSGGAWAELTIGSPVPEPSSLVLFGLGAAGLAMQRRRRLRR